MYQSLPPYPQAALEAKRDKVSAWDVVYSLNMGMACLITYWIITHLVYGFVDQASNFLGGMWAVVAVIFVFRDTRAHALSAGIARLIATCVSFALALPLAFPVYASRPRNPARHRHARDGAVEPARGHRDNRDNHHGCHGGCGNEPRRGLAAASAAPLRYRRRHRSRGHLQMDRFVSVFPGRAAT